MPPSARPRGSMPPIPSAGEKAQREYSQLLRLNERLLSQLLRMREELRAPGTQGLLRTIRSRTGQAPTESMGDIASSVEEAIRALKLCESEIRNALIQEHEDFEVEGIPNLPLPLARFLAERQQFPGFSYEVLQDEVRGWVIRWKEYTSRGTVRGFGQFYERPYAWLDD